MTFRAVVIGAGWAGEGHTNALRAAGVDVIAMCGRTPEPAKAMGEKLDIKDVRFDWQEAIEKLKPDIVSIATPAAPHHEMVIASSQLGCHIACDKPLALNAKEAREILLAVENAGVKHAYATTSRYEPVFLHTHTLLANGLIGQVREIEYISHFNFPPLMPFHWFHQLSQGGGWLYNAFTHELGQVLAMTGGKVLTATGEARRLIDRAPIGPTLHDFRDFFDVVVDPEQAEAGEWGEVDADTAFTVMTQLQLPDSHTTSALFKTSGMSVSQHPNYAAFYGSKGTLYLSGSVWASEHIQHYDQESQEWRDITVPKEVIKSLPQVEDRVQGGWNQLFLEFVADVRGEGHAGYPTFHDGWVAAEVIEIVRKNPGYTSIPEHPIASS